jgi:hypothetical protein
MIDDECGAVGEFTIGRGNKYLEKTYSSATLSTTNPTLLDLGSNLGRHSGKTATKRLSYGTTLTMTNVGRNI